jgi:hypothetical protein
MQPSLKKNWREYVTDDEQAEEADDRDDNVQRAEGGDGEDEPDNTDDNGQRAGGGDEQDGSTSGTETSEVGATPRRTERVSKPPNRYGYP